MKCLLVDVNTVVKDNLSTCWCLLTRLAKEKKDGKLYHHKKGEVLQAYPVEQTKNYELYNKISKLKPGSLIDIEYAVNDFGKAVIKDLIVVKESPYTYDELYK